jgi:hypothetical protein
MGNYFKILNMDIILLQEAQILQLEARLEGQFLRGWNFPEWVEDDPALLEAIMQVQDPFRIDEDRFGAYNVGQERILYNVYRAVSLYLIF